MGLKFLDSHAKFKRYKKSRQLMKVARSISRLRHRRINEYLKEHIDSVSSFSVASKFGGKSADWRGTPLIYICEVSGDDELSAMYLGILVVEFLTQHKDEWMCTKSNLNGRGFESNFYWKKEA